MVKAVTFFFLGILKPIPNGYTRASLGTEASLAINMSHPLSGLSADTVPEEVTCIPEF